MWEWIRFTCCAAFMIVGAVVMLISAIGNLRFRHVLPRMHAAAMEDTIGEFFIFLGLMIYDWEGMVWIKILFILLFFWVSGPVSSHLLARFQINLDRERKEREEERS